jgi:predicted nuclease of restriction endonuclease-like (RecB) superfamily
MRVEDIKVRQYNIDEAANQQWYVLQLERQINSFYYKRLLALQDKGQAINAQTANE